MRHVLNRIRGVAGRAWIAATTFLLAATAPGFAFAAVSNPCGSGGTGIGAAFGNLMTALQHFGAPVAGAVVVYGGLKHFFGHTPQARMEANHVLYAAGIGLAITLLAPSIANTLVSIVGGGCP